MPRYRLYRLNGNGAVSDYEDAELPDDTLAVQFARENHQGVVTEVWGVEGRVATLRPYSPEPHAGVTVVMADLRAR